VRARLTSLSASTLAAAHGSDARHGRARLRSNRTGSSEGALLCSAHLAEEVQTLQALLILHTLFRAQRREGREANGGHSLAEIGEIHARMLDTWSELQGIDCYLTSDWQRTPLPFLIRIGVVETLPASTATPQGDPHSRGRIEERCNADGSLSVRLKPMDQALAIAQGCWNSIGEGGLHGLQSSQDTHLV
jgi:hypothetical protein